MSTSTPDPIGPVPTPPTEGYTPPEAAVPPPQTPVLPSPPTENLMLGTPPTPPQVPYTPPAPANPPYSQPYQAPAPMPSYGQSSPAPSPSPTYGSMPGYGSTPAPGAYGSMPPQGAYSSIPDSPIPAMPNSSLVSTGSGPYVLSPWAKRAKGAVIDWIVPGIVASIFSAIGGLIPTIITILMYAFMIYNMWYLQGKTGQTFGKKWAGTRLIRESTGQAPGIGLAVGRFFCHSIDSAIMLIGWLFPLFTPKKQTIADMITGTLVVDD